jgi:hypothetical protein
MAKFKSARFLSIISELNPDNSLEIGVRDGIPFYSLTPEVNGAGDARADRVKDLIRKNLSSHKLDLLFMSGEDAYKTIKENFTYYSEFVRHGGVIAFHDIAKNGKETALRKFWDEARTRYRHEEITEVQSDGHFGIGVLYV